MREKKNGKSTNPPLKRNGLLKMTKSMTPELTNEIDRNIGKKRKRFRFLSKYLQSIKIKLIIGLLIPIILLGMYGFMSY